MQFGRDAQGRKRESIFPLVNLLGEGKGCKDHRTNLLVHNRNALIISRLHEIQHIDLLPVSCGKHIAQGFVAWCVTRLSPGHR
jgi:hypothetical protein